MGIGRICSQKERKDSEKSKSDCDTDVIVPYDGGDIWIKRIASPAYNNTGQLTIGIDTCSGIKTNVQRLVYRHSPTGFNFGYGGSGPADLALNICRMFCKDDQFADSIYKEFKFKFCATGENELVIPVTAITEFIQSKKKVYEP